MMNNAQQLLDLAEIGHAAYGQYLEPRNIEDIALLTNLNNSGGGFATAQADRFRMRFAVAVPTYNDISPTGASNSNFDATVFRGIAPDNLNQITLSIRGTQQLADFPESGSIAPYGAAFEQIVAMHNWWQRVGTPAGTVVAQFCASERSNGSTTPSLMFEITRVADVTSTGEVAQFLMEDPDGKLDVVGTSLGGHLAMAFAGLFGSQISQAAAFNSPGFAANSDVTHLFSALGGLIPTGRSPNVLNFISDEANKSGASLDVIAGLHSVPGQRVDVPIEDQFLTNVPDPKFPSYNHDQRQVDDVLTLYAFFSRIQADLSLDSLRTFMRNAATGSAASLENLVNATESFLGLPKSVLPANNAGRDALHSAMGRLDAALDGLLSTSLGSLLMRASSADLRAAARNDFSAVIALQDLSPIWISGKTAAADATLTTLWQSARAADYAAWQADKTTANPETFTDQWIADRAAMLGALVERNKTDAGIVSSTRNILYYDKASNTQVLLGAGDAQRIQYLFGDEGADPLDGKGYADHLFGGSGNDTMDGKGGNDYLEGNADNDALNGGEGRDTLLGGGGDDTLDGGAGADILKGGQGSDTYVFVDAFGTDAIIDSDGLGQIRIGAVTLTGGNKQSDNVWESADKHYSFTVVGVNLIIGRGSVGAALPMQGTITVQGWSPEKNLGITLPSAPAVQTPPTQIYKGDQHGQLVTNPETGSQSYHWASTSWARDGTLVNGVVEENYKDVISGSGGNDKISGLGGNDALDGGGGNDQIDGGEGDDLVGGGAGSDNILGGAGNDAILSATGLNVFQRSGPAATWSPTLAGNGGSITMDDAPDVIDAGTGDDQVYAGRGDDRIEGGAGKDVLWGLAGNDIMGGGEGDDQLIGDGVNAPNSYASTLGEAHGSDFLDGGEGNDSLIGFGKGDVLYGGEGADRMYGDGYAGAHIADSTFLAGQYHGDDYIDGEDGDDYVEGNGGADIVYGGAGMDTLWGDAAADILGGEFHGADYIDGEDGNDDIVGGGAADTLYGGAGNDRIRGDSSGLLPWETGYLAGQHHAADYLDGEDGDDEMTGDGGADTLYGGAGNDVLYGDETLDKLAAEFHGDDYLDGEDGDDRLVGGNGDDTLYGGSGNDTLMGGAGADYMNGEAGSDSYEAGAGDTVADTNGVNILTLVDAGPFTVSASGSDLVLDYGDTGKLRIEAALTGSMASINGVAMSEWLRNHLSDDTDLQSTDEDQVLNGGAGDDELTAYHSGAILQGGYGDDLLTGWAGSATLRGGEGHDAIIATGASNTLSGGQGSDTLIAGLGDDMLDGGGDDDSLAGGAGSDTLLGGEGSDLVDGGDGDDLIYADRGVDTLRGGSGLDTYVLGYGTDQAILEDVSQEGSVIQLDASGLRFQSLTAKRSDNDLLVEVRGTDTSMRIKDYYASSQTSWVFKDADGNMLSAQALVEASKPQWDILRSDLLQNFKLEAKGAIGEDYFAQGFTQQADGGWYSNYAPYEIKRYFRQDIFYREYTTQPIENNLWSSTTSTVHLYNDQIYFSGWAGDTTIAISEEIQSATGKTIVLGVSVSGDVQDAWLGFDWSLGPQTGTISPWRYQTFWHIQADGSYVLATQREQRFEMSQTDMATASSVVFNDPGPAAVAGSLPDYRLFDYYRERRDYNLGEIMLADGDHTVNAYEFSAVIGGVGNNTILDAGFAYGGTGNGSLIGGGTLMAGAGDQYLENGRIMVVGDGHTTVLARSMSETYRDPSDPFRWITHRAGSQILVDPDNAGMDLLVSDFVRVKDRDFDGLDDVVEAIYGVLHINVQEAYQHGGKFAWQGEWETFYSDSLEQAHLSYTEQWGHAPSGEAVFRYVEPLTALLKSPFGYDVPYWQASDYYDAHPLPAVVLNAHDFAGLQPYFDAGLTATTVSFGPGLSMSDISLSWGKTISPLDGKLRVTLDLQWGPDQGLRVMIPRTDDALNAAVHRFEFVDGSVVWLSDLVDAAPSAPNFDVGYVQFYESMGQQSAAAAATPIIQASTFAEGDVVIRSEGIDLIISSLDGQDSLRLVGWYANPGEIPDTGMILANEAYLNADLLHYQGLVKDASAGHLTVYGIPGFATTFIAGSNTNLIGLSGSDVYLYNAGTGEVHITDAGGGTLRFGSGITPDMLSLAIGSLMLTVGDQGDVVHIDGLNPSQADSFWSVQNFEFADGTELNYQQLLEKGFDIRGSAGDDVLTGTNLADRFYGVAGLDTMQGGGGDDTYFVDSTGDIVFEDADEGYDRVISTVSYTAPTHVEAITLAGGENLHAAGNELNNSLVGNSGSNRLEGAGGHDVLDGGEGADTLVGGQGNDTYHVDDAADVIIEKSNEGIDTVITTVTDSLSAHVENMTLAGWAAINATGNSLNNELVGNIANNTLNGGAGADFMQGGLGNDSYYVDNVHDVVYENGAQGTDRVLSSISYTLGEYLEDLQLTGTADNSATGNEDANKLTGNSGANILIGEAGDDELIGGLGADTMMGGQGHDLYQADNALDVVTELAGEGTDTVESTVTYTLGSNVENLILTGTAAIDGSGNELNNVLQGNTADNLLSGGAGNDYLNGMKGLDTLAGGAGNDTYLFEDDLDTIMEEVDGGRDTLISRIGGATLADSVEDGVLLGSAASLSGNALSNVLSGNNAANTLDGGLGADVLIGGKGNDLYIVDSQTDTVVENAAEGADTIQASVNYSLGDNVEHLTLTGSAEAGMGNALANKLTGNTESNELWGLAGNDELDGGQGADILLGGLGNDKYWVDSSDDLVVENVQEGTDTVYASVSYALADNVEHLTLTGSANINAVGNAGNNWLEGNAGNNILFGGLGSDTYVFGRGSGHDIIANFDAGKPSGDTVQLGAGIAEADLAIAKQGNDLILSINGSADQLTVANYFENAGKGTHALEKIRFADGTSWNHAAVLSRASAEERNSAAPSLPAEVRAGNPAALFDAPDPAETQASETTTTPQTVAESIAAARERFEQGLQNLKYGVDEQSSLSRSEFAERRALPLLWNLQDALLDMQLAKNPDGRFTSDISMDSRGSRDLSLAIGLLGGASGVSGRLDQVARPQEVQQFDLAQMQ